MDLSGNKIDFQLDTEFTLADGWYELNLPYTGQQSEIKDIKINDESIEHTLYTGHYVDGNGTYKVYMLENGLLRGEYYTYDTLNYFVTGEWQLLDHDQIYLKADQYIDGTFKIEHVNANKMILSTESNYVTFFNIGEIKSVIRISRGDPGNQSDTRP